MITKTTEYLRYQFTRAEMSEHALSLARKNQELAELDLRQKRLQADINAAKKSANEAIAQLAGWISHGHDYRMVVCEVKFNDPVDGKKTTYRTDTNDWVKTADMDAAEVSAQKQQGLPFDGVQPDKTTYRVDLNAQAGQAPTNGAAPGEVANTNGVAATEPAPGEPGSVVDAEFPKVEPEPDGGPAIASQAEMSRSERKRQAAGRRAN